MCQYSNSKKLVRAKEDIITYKIMRKTIDPLVYNAAIMSKFKYILGKRYTQSIFKIIWNRKKSKFNDRYTFDKGFHSYVNMNTVSRYLECYYNYDNKHVVVECIVPRGSYYNISGDGKTLVSNKIIIK